ncbi:hypothetical protein BGX29_008482 [Mortierella sp. GBA35]|nr:hypothetical protein BGX29_008482 [Mortierella sp. GBA35]
MVHAFFNPAQVADFNALAPKTDSTFEIAESDSIERYLARKFGLVGRDAFEGTLVNTFVSHDTALINQIFSKYATVRDAEVKAANKEPLISNNIVPWVKYHEEHLQGNGANGHYVGNKVTLADIKTDLIITLIQSLTGEDLVSEEKTPAIWRVRVELDKVEGVAAWKKTEEYKLFSEKNLALLGF